MKNLRRMILTVLLTVFMIFPTLVYGNDLPYAYTSQSINGFNVSYVTLNVNDERLKPVVLNANNNIISTQSVSTMAQSVDAIAAINGTYFEAYSGTPVPWGVIVKDGKLLHLGNYGSTVGITDDNELIIDTIKIDLKGYINGEHRSIPWRINHPSTEPDAITIFTHEYGGEVAVQPGTLTAIVENEIVTQISSSNFTVPYGGFAISYNPTVSHLVTERFSIGDSVYYEYEYVTSYTNPSDWANVTSAIGAGPSLIINGQITANPEAEGFYEAKITTNKGSRTFIGATSEGKILMGYIPNATISEAAGVASSLGLVNAMCLDGGGSTALYYKDMGSITAGRDVNNGLAFVMSGMDLTPVVETNITVKIQGEDVVFTDETGRPFADENNRTQVPLRITMESAGAEVDWDNDTKTAIVMKDEITVEATIGEKYITVDGETFENDTEAVAKDGRTYLPIRAVLEAFGYEVSWDTDTSTVVVE